MTKEQILWNTHQKEEERTGDQNRHVNNRKNKKGRILK
jgi:hypothetical protein